MSELTRQAEILKAFQDRRELQEEVRRLRGLRELSLEYQRMLRAQREALASRLEECERSLEQERSEKHSYHQAADEAFRDRGVLLARVAELEQAEKMRDEAMAGQGYTPKPHWESHWDIGSIEDV